MSTFDPYYTLLGIPPGEQPPTHYRLLGLAPYESNAEVILNASARQMRYLRSIGRAYADHAQRLLNEVAAAKLCLRDAARKAEYDGALRRPGVEIERPATAPAGAAELPAVSVEVPAGTAPAVRTARASRSIDHSPCVSWTIGSSAECDFVVEGVIVSRRHCRLSRFQRQLVLEDLGSTNGTYVNGIRITQPVYVRRRDRITLGKSTPLPWPDGALG